MAEPRPPLADLLGPLRFVTGPGARLERIGGLVALVRAKVGAWRATPPPDASRNALAARWLAALDDFDEMPPERREAALRAVLAGIEGELAGVPAPPGAAPEATRGAGRHPRQPGPAPGAGLPLDAAVGVLPGVGERRQALLARLGIHTLDDLLLHLPSRYEDRRQVEGIATLSPGRPGTVRARVEAVEVKTTPRRRMKIVEALVTDASAMGGAMVMRWFNQPHRSRQLAAGAEYLFSGKAVVDRNGLSLVMENPEFEPWEAGEDTLHAGRVVAVYPVTEGLNSALLRGWVAAALARAQVDDPIDPALRRRLDLPERAAALALAHRPERPELAAAGVRRLAFEEFYYLQLGLALKAAGRARRHTGITFPDRPGALETALLRALPFALTDAQTRVLADIGRDLARDVPTQRLIQGDVGCGKTVVALLALLRAVDNGFQGAIMAPTEVLAAQHHRKIGALLDGLPVGVELLLGGARGKARALARIAGGEARLVVGTQALIQDKVAFHKLGLAVVDEQHRFGVRQRAQMAAKGQAPHTLIMTATPIPRSLAMTVYGDLDLSVIDALPPGRRPVTTRLFFEDRRDRAYDLVRKEVAAGRRAYVVHPLVEESEKIDLRAATAAYEELAAGALAGIRLGLLHGRMAGEEKARVMADFASGAIPVLVTTTVVEVGVDVAEATVMVIEHAERFGLSQLHQLRGRVGRGGHAGFCLLVASHAVSKEGRQRLDAMVETDDGFRIAERDLEIRGPGELFGQRQSGVPELRVANLIRDAALLAAAREAARRTIEADPELAAPAHGALRDTVTRLWRHRLKWGAVG
ncbi:MAG: ATP-dependent DNA helicase RecG [Nitrospirae bacterium]|nr:ATP-dependent DNA helicase RecG [Nitrospirota bacterium]